MIFKKEKKAAVSCLKQAEENLEYLKAINENPKFEKELNRLADEVRFSYPSKEPRVRAVESDILKLTEDLKIHIALRRRDERIQGVLDEINDLIIKRNSMI